MTGKPRMLALTCLIVLAAVALTFVGPASAQQASPAAQTQAGQEQSSRRPGIVQNGRFLGFVPKHEREIRSRNSQIPANTPLTTSIERSTRQPQQSAVQLASYEEVVGYGGSVSNSVDSCQDCGQCCGQTCGPKIFVLYGGAEYVHWWTNGTDFHSLVTTSPDGTVQDDAGVLPAAATRFGGDDVFDDSRGGGRFHLGMYLNPARTAAVEFWYTFLGEETASFAGSDADFSILARPFFNVDLNEEDSRLIAFDDLVSGSLSINASSEFDSLELLLRKQMSTAYGARSDFLFGYRRAYLDEMIRFEESTTSLAAPTQDTTFDLFDQFMTENEFHGAEFGIDYKGPAVGCWSMGLLAKVALGNTSSRVNISGETTTTNDIGDSTTNAGGLLTQASNIGSHNDDEFSTLAEFGIKFTRQFNSGLGLSIGYSFLQWSDVARVSGQIDRNVNPTQIPPGTLTGDAVPARQSTRDDFRMQGLNAGIEYSF